MATRKKSLMTKIGDAVEQLAKTMGLTADERAQLLPSGRQTRFANRVNWAKAYLAKAGLVLPDAASLTQALQRGEGKP